MRGRRAVRSLWLGVVVATLCAAVMAPVHAARSRVGVGALTLEAPADRETILHSLAREAEVIAPRLERDLGVRPRAPYTLVLIPGGLVADPEIAQLDAAAPGYASGFLFPEARVGGIRLDAVNAYPHDGLNMVLAHEMAHMLIHDAAGDSVPRWFGEGVASWEGRRRGLRDFFVESSTVLAGNLPPMSMLDREFGRSPTRTRLAYALSFDFVSWCVGRYGEDFLPVVLRRSQARGFDQAWREATGETLAESEARWRKRSLFFHRWLPILTSSGTLWLLVTGLALVAGVRRRKRSQEQLERWDEEEERLEELAGADDSSVSGVLDLEGPELEWPDDEPRDVDELVN